LLRQHSSADQYDGCRAGRQSRDTEIAASRSHGLTRKSAGKTRDGFAGFVFKPSTSYFGIDYFSERFGQSI
jgi:hypothetical protein